MERKGLQPVIEIRHLFKLLAQKALQAVGHHDDLKRAGIGRKNLDQHPDEPVKVLVFFL